MNRTVYIKDLKKSFLSGEEKIEILKGVNLTLFNSEIATIIGSSGSGKSTLLNLIAGIDTLDSGDIIVNNYNVASLKEKELNKYRNQNIGLIFQFHYLIEDFTAFENIIYPALIKGMDKRDIQQKAIDLLKEIKLENKKNIYPSVLSGGEKQRVAVARALINDPALILADEPTGSLDKLNSELVRDMLLNMTKKHNSNLIFVTHDQSLFELGDRKFILNDGLLEEN